MSVCGTGTYNICLEDFLGSLIRLTIHAAVALWYYQVQLMCGFAYTINVYTLQRTIPSVREAFTTPSLHHYYK